MKDFFGHLAILAFINRALKRFIPAILKCLVLKKPQLGLSTDWPKISALIEPALEYAEFRFETSKSTRIIGKFSKLTLNQILDIYQPKFSRNGYLKLLASKQDAQFGIIPILEFQNKQLEESFIFRFRTITRRILVAWKNANEGRATHLFITEDHNMEERLKRIESFIIESTPLKRTMLHVKNADSKLIQKELMYIETISHNNIGSYKSDLEFNIGRY